MKNPWKNHHFTRRSDPLKVNVKKNHLWKQKNVTVSRLEADTTWGWINIWNESTIINHHEQSLIIINHQHHWQLVLDLRVLKEQKIGDDFLNKLNQFVCWVHG